jgi:serine/threonine protein phosphatase PrpC
MKILKQSLLNISLDVCGTTHAGKIRKNNEDSFLVMTNSGCFAVSDGMGGGSAGEIASKMIVQRIEQKLKSTGKSPAARERAVIQAANSCNQDINTYCIEHNYESMGATLACLLLDSWDPGFATIFHSGDSRVYRWRQGKLEQMTRDHTLAEAEHINESELPKDQQGILTNVLGISSDFFLERLSCDVDNGDMFPEYK